MAKKAKLEAQEAKCSDGEAYAELAMKALKKPKDLDYAKELMEKGESASSFPIHYVKLAEVAVALGDKDKAEVLYEEAESMCFEDKEKVDIGFSIAVHLDNKEKGRALIESAMADTTDTGELLSLAGKIQEGLGDAKLANSIFDKITANCKTVEAYKELAKTVKANGDDATAKMIFEKAASLPDGTDEIVDYAAGFVELFGDKDKAKEILAGHEGDCMFPGQFVSLAKGFQTLLDDKEKATELLEQGKEFAMSGEENLDLAEGYASLLGDEATAAEMYETALGDFSSKDDLFKLAGSVANNMKDKAIAAKAYEKVEGNMTTVADLTLLAQAVNDDLGDKEKVAAIYERAEAKLDKPAELVALAGEVIKNLNDVDKASKIYRKALDNSSSYTDTGKLLDAFANADGRVDTDLVKDTLSKSLDVAEENAQLLDIAKRSSKLIADDNSITLKALDNAEENVSSLDEMRQLSSAVKDLAGDDETRNTRIADKLAKREASQAVYIELQAREKALTRPSQFIALADEVMEKLDDAAYAAQLLSNAEEKLKVKSFNLANYAPLIVAVSNLAKDHDWAIRLLNQGKDNSNFFAQIRELGLIASSKLADLTAGKQWAADLYASWKEKLDGDEASSYEYIKLANAVNEDLADKETISTLLDAAAGKANDHFQYAYLAELAKELGDNDRSDSLTKEAAAACNKSTDYVQLVSYLRKSSVAEDTLKALYAQGENISDAGDKLSWAEGIVTLFDDKKWAGEAYDSLSDSFTGTKASILATSKKRLGNAEQRHHFW